MSIKAYDFEQSLAWDINCLASCIIIRLADKTIALQAKGIAQWMLVCKKIPLQQAIALIRDKSTVKFLHKLLRGQSEFLGPTPRSVGIDLTSEISAAKIQQSLDVKHIKKPPPIPTNGPSTGIVSANANITNTGHGRNQQRHRTGGHSTQRQLEQEHFQQLDRIRPQIKTDILYTNPNRMWIRCYTVLEQQILNDFLPQQYYSVLQIAPNVYEIYGARNLVNFNQLINYLESQLNVDIIFCSELPAFFYNPLLFLSNFIKFMWCYSLNRNIFNPTSYTDLRTVLVYYMQGLLFLNTNNLSNMPTSTHGPLISCTGERPRTALSKFNADTVYINEGSRALQTYNKPSDFGTQSNFMEIISTLDTNKMAEELQNII